MQCWLEAITESDMVRAALRAQTRRATASSWSAYSLLCMGLCGPVSGIICWIICGLICGIIYVIDLYVKTRWNSGSSAVLEGDGGDGDGGNGDRGKGDRRSSHLVMAGSSCWPRRSGLSGLPGLPGWPGVGRRSDSSTSAGPSKRRRSQSASV